ncbi:MULTISPECIES: TniQ family protein [Paraburkholderia]|uniref:TniQ family protein n=1 Tax=Paraburkholderia TaxID=1822464 RepID=UPI0022548FAB|nr:MULTISPECIES: TniQ family protein [Paraburkholderia]MCX4173720.1 TniQ family protein [Paraburkholderia madseniana]MDQ6461725.1 TniQ family protein [Paraburkholderia madseniana]
MSAPPFGLPRYPDEILGSWLSRLRLHNGDGWWRVALRDAGHGSRSDENVFDIPGHSPRLATLLRSIGVAGEEHALLDLTTLPYWLAFDAAPPEVGQLSGTTLNVLLGTRKEIVRNVAAMARRYRARVGIRFCPRCLDDDFRTFGEPYWHRTHQLPNVTCCPDHRIRLKSCCPRCGRGYLADGASRAPLPRMQCECGWRLSQAHAPIAEMDIEYKLALVSRDALLARAPLCSRSQMRDFFRSRLQSRELARFIEDAYGQSALSRSLPDSIRDSDGWLWLPLSHHFSQLRAPDCCALLAAMDISLSVAQRSAAVLDEVQREREDCGRPRTVPSVESARRAMLARTRNRPSERASADGLNYWVLRLLDADWLRRHFPQSRFTSVPSVQTDRKWIARSATAGISNDRTRTYHWRLIAQSVAGRRAAVRDCTWFESQRCEYFRFRTDSPVRPRDQTVLLKPTISMTAVAHHARALRVALQTTLDDWPRVRVTVARLARLASITLPMAKNTLMRDRALAFEVRCARKTRSDRCREDDNLRAR